jgi:single-stranded-DNA-specific exonuclease
MDQRIKRWRVSPRIPPDVDQALAPYPRVIRQSLFNRGIATTEKARQYLECQPLAGLDPFNLLGIETAVERLDHAIRTQEKIVVYGDYDVDGVTATALLTLVLEAMGATVIPYIPNRFDEGYGLNIEALDTLKSEGASLVVTVDCGIRSLDEAEHARQVGLDMIISDHHHPGQALPDALAIINPKQAGDRYPEKELAGVGLAYKLAQALIIDLEATHINPESYLDLVALGTVADLAPLVGENRLLVRQGLEWLRQPHRQGLLSLMRVAGIRIDRLNAGNIGFGIGPRLNAAGRLDTAEAALTLLMTNDVSEAGALALHLDSQNRDRQKLTRDIQQRAEELAFIDEDDPLLIFASDPEFNPGIVGLAASRLSESYYRPAVVAHQAEDYTRGSCRSIPEFHITEALDQCQDLLVRHGGHAAAAGFTVLNEHVGELKSRLREIADQQLAGVDLRPLITADAELPLSELKPDLLIFLDQMEPTGYGNHQPLFVSRDLFLDPNRTRAVGQDGNHLKMTVTDGRITFDGIGFRLGHWMGRLPHKVDLLYTFELNEYNGRVNLQLNVKDLKPSGIPDDPAP